MKKNIIITLILAMTLSIFTGCQSNVTNGNGDNNSNGNTGNLELSLSEVIEKTYEIKESGISVESMPVDLNEKESVKYFTGIDDVSRIKEALVSESMIGSQAYSFVLVRTNDSKDSEDVAKEMLNGIDQRKWICVEADDLQVASYGDLVMLVMVSSALEDTVTSTQLVDAFKQVCGGSLDIELKK